MKTVEYVGRGSEELGRFGTVRHGDRLSLYEHEWEGVRDDERFNLLGGAAPLFGAYPKLTDAYDLRKIPWGRPPAAFFSWLRDQGKINMLQIALGMAQAGVEFDVFDGDSPLDVLADKVQELANAYGWTSLTGEEIWNGPAIPEVNKGWEPSVIEDDDDIPYIPQRAAPKKAAPKKKKRKYVRRK
jgi:hypothetical protein